VVLSAAVAAGLAVVSSWGTGSGGTARTVPDAAGVAGTKPAEDSR